MQGESIGDLQQLGPNGEWITTATGVTFDQLTDEQLELITGPMAGTNTDPVQTSQNSGFPDQSGELGDNTAGGGFQEEAENAGDGIAMPGTDIETNRLTPEDLIIEARSDPVELDDGRTGTIERIHNDRGNSQVVMDSGELWNVPEGQLNNIPAIDPIGDQLQSITSDVASNWDPAVHLTDNEQSNIDDLRADGDYGLAQLQQQRARGRWVERSVRARSEELGLNVQWGSVNSGLDAQSATIPGVQYDIMSGTNSNRDTHATREPDKLFRMITF